MDDLGGGGGDEGGGGKLWCGFLSHGGTNNFGE